MTEEEMEDEVYGLNCVIGALRSENAKLLKELEAEHVLAETLGHYHEHAKAENAKLREQMERLVTLLRVDCDIDASWDGLRRFWSIELTESGCLMRDRACRAEAENAKLRELVKDMWPHVRHRSRMCGECKLPCDTSDECLLYEPMRQRMRELGIEVDE